MATREAKRDRIVRIKVNHPGEEYDLVITREYPRSASLIRTLAKYVLAPAVAGLLVLIVQLLIA